MNYRWHAVKTISRRRIFETFISPSFYIAMSLGLVLGYLLVAGFVDSVDSSGLNYGLNPIYELLAKALSGAFGDTYVFKLFSEGPFLFALHVSFFPFLIYLALSGVFKFGFEKNVGALELLTYGPADGTSCFLAFVIRNILFSLVYLIVLLVYFVVVALINNLVLGPQFFFALILMLFLCLAVFAYGALTSVLANNSSVGVAIFVGGILFFALIQMGSFTIISGYVKSLSSALAGLIQWVSPLYYWNQGFSAVDYGNVAGLLINLIFLVGLTFVILLASHFVMTARGVRE